METIHPRELARAIDSLANSTAITVLHGPSYSRLDINGRNGRRPTMTVSPFSPADGFRQTTCLDNGKYRLIIDGPAGVDYPSLFLVTLDRELERHAIPLGLRREMQVRVAVERCADRDGNVVPYAGAEVEEVVVLPPLIPVEG